MPMYHSPTIATRRCSVSPQEMRDAVDKLGGVDRSATMINTSPRSVEYWMNEGLEDPSAQCRLVILLGLLALHSRHSPATEELQFELLEMILTLQEPAKRGKDRSSAQSVIQPLAMTIEELRTHIARIGSQASLGRVTGISGVRISQWITGHSTMPRRYVEAIRAAMPERKTERPAVSRAQLERLILLFGNQKQAARELQISRSAMSEYCRGKATVPSKVAARITKILRQEFPESESSMAAITPEPRCSSSDSTLAQPSAELARAIQSVVSEGAREG